HPAVHEPVLLGEDPARTRRRPRRRRWGQLMSAILPEVPQVYESPLATSDVSARRISQPHMEDRPARGTRRDRIESLITFLIVAAGAFLVGYHVLTTNHVVVFTALDHLT